MTNANTAARKPATLTEAKRLFTAALSLVESDSIRQWAREQEDSWVKILLDGCGTLAGVPVFECAAYERGHRVAAFIVATAIGL